MDKQAIISKTIDYVRKSLEGAEAGHDWWHIQRVYANAKQIAQDEQVDIFIVELAALLHDIADAKFNDGNDEIGAIQAKEFLLSIGVEQNSAKEIYLIIKHCSFKGGNVSQEYHSKELEVIQDADRLDAMGAIGIARTFNYGGFKGREIYNPAIKPQLNMTKEEYYGSTAPTINHFYEKLLLLKERMNTKAGKRIAEKRHQFMEQYLEQFYAEWNGDA